MATLTIMDAYQHDFPARTYASPRHFQYISPSSIITAEEMEVVAGVVEAETLVVEAAIVSVKRRART